MKKSLAFAFALTCSAALADDFSSVNVTPPGMSLGTAIQSVQSLHGSHEGVFSANSLTISSDDAATTDGAFGWNYSYSFGGAAMHGHRLGISLQSVFTAADDGAAIFPPSGPNYVSFAPSMTVNASNHGTGSTTGTARGAYFVMNPVLVGSAASSNLYAMTVQENNVSCPAGCSTAYKAALSLVSLSGDAVQGTETDALLVLSSTTGTVGSRAVIQIGPDNGKVPFNAASTLINLSGGGTALNGINLSGGTFLGSSFKSAGFSVDGAGHVLGRSLYADGPTPQVAFVAGGAGMAGVQWYPPGSQLLVDTYVANAPILFRVNGTEEARVDTGGINVPSGNSYRVNNVSGITATLTVRAAADCNIVVSGGIITSTTC